MRDNISCEEFFESSVCGFRGNWNVSDEWAADVTEQQALDASKADEADDRCWCKFFESCPECFGA